MRPSVLALSLFVAIAGAACGGSTPSATTPAAPPAPSATGAAPASAGVKAPGEAKIGDKTKCLVSGEEFTVTEASPHVDYKGKTYYFCCGDCAPEFQKDPEKYLKKAGLST